MRPMVEPGRIRFSNSRAPEGPEKKKTGFERTSG